MSPGTWVDDLVFAACEGRSGPAHLLSALSWQQGAFSAVDRDTGEATLIPRSPLVIAGCRWTFASDRQLARRLGYPFSSIQRWRTWLEEKGLIHTENWKFGGWNTSGLGVVHYRLDADKLYQALVANRGKIEPWKRARLVRKPPAPARKGM